MKGVVIACKQIVEIVEDCESQISLPTHKETNLQDLKSDLSEALTGIMSVAKSEAKEITAESIMEMDAKASVLNRVVTSLLTLIEAEDMNSSRSVEQTNDSHISNDTESDGDHESRSITRAADLKVYTFIKNRYFWNHKQT
jgi:hypothetical protein